MSFFTQSFVLFVQVHLLSEMYGHWPVVHRMVALLVLLLLPLTLSTLLTEDGPCDGMHCPGCTECRKGCCPMSNGFCCRNLNYCAESWADCEANFPCPPECDKFCFLGECLDHP